MRRQRFAAATVLLIPALFILMITHGAECAAFTAAGLKTIARVLPSVFPYLALIGLAEKSRFFDLIGEKAGGFCERVFRLPRAACGAVAAGLICGFPTGARCAATLCKEGKCSPEDASRLTAFCNFLSPPFLVGAVGAGLLGSAGAGAALYLLQTLFALVFGALYRRPKRVFVSLPPPAGRKRGSAVSLSVLPEAIVEATMQTLRICGIILFFSVLSGILSLLLPARAAKNGIFMSLFIGAFEFSSGVAFIPAGDPAAFFCAAVITGLSGISVAAQCASFVNPAGISMRGFALAHLLCPCFTCGALLLMRLAGFL